MKLTELYKLDLEVYLNIPDTEKRNYLRLLIKEQDPFVKDLIINARSKFPDKLIYEINNSELTPRIIDLRKQRDELAGVIKKEVDKCYLKLITEISILKKELPM
jgi:hypothetical protein